MQIKTIYGMMFISLLFYCSHTKAQIIKNSFVVFKKQYLYKTEEAFDSALNIKVNILLTERLYVAKKPQGNYIIISEPLGNVNVKVLSNRVIFVDNLEKKRREKFLTRQFARIDKEYSIAKNIKNERLDTIDLAASAMDSIYENFYSPLREQVVKSWLFDRDSILLNIWFKFLRKYSNDDDGLNTKYLTICFLKYPDDFSQTLNNQKENIRKFLANKMLGSSGFQYATSELEMDYEKYVKLFKKLVILK